MPPERPQCVCRIQYYHHRRGPRFPHLTRHPIPTLHLLPRSYVAGVGSDPREDRYFLIPKQARDYDRDGSYCRAWVPELARAPTDGLHDPRSLTEGHRGAGVYPAPVVALLAHRQGRAGPPGPAFKNAGGAGGGRSLGGRGGGHADRGKRQGGHAAAEGGAGDGAYPPSAPAAGPSTGSTTGGAQAGAGSPADAAQAANRARAARGRGRVQHLG